jgi:UrcA family protein
MDYSNLRAPVSLGCAALVLLGLAGFGPAQAAQPGTTRAVTVKYQDLNLNTPEEAGRLLARIRDAARRVCGPESERLDLEYAWRVCYEGSINAAVTTVDNPILSALASGHQLPGGDRNQARKAAPSN